VQQALALAPQDENALDVEGAVFLQQHKLDQAEAILRKATTINPRHENALFNLGATLLYQGKTDEAATEFEAVRRLCPLYPQIDDILKSVKSQ
jgi:Flp pilus assembly protein TadD